MGAADSIADIVGACVALDLLGVEEVHVSAINVGSGTVKTEHGVLPVPAPATAALLDGKPVYARGPAMELTTPTGAALAATLGSSFGALPPMRISSIGYGAGDRDFHGTRQRAARPDRRTDSAPEATLVSVIEANIDDSSPQVLGYALERLIEAGRARCVSLAASDEEEPPGLAAARHRAGRRIRSGWRRSIFAETSTLGLRIHAAERRVEERAHGGSGDAVRQGAREKSPATRRLSRRNTKIAARIAQRTGVRR